MHYILISDSLTISDADLNGRLYDASGIIPEPASGMVAGPASGMVTEPVPGYGLRKFPDKELRFPDKEPRFLDLRSDACFRYVFGKEAGKDLLLDFVNSVLEDRTPIRDLRLCATERTGETAQSRGTRVDLLFTTDQGDKVLLEMQRRRQDFFSGRALYYGHRVGSDLVPAGKEGDDFKLPTKPDQWLYLFRNLGKMQEQPGFLSGTLFDKLFQITDVKNIRKEDRTMLIDHERDRRNQDSVLKREARAEGLEQGRLEGSRQEKLSFVQILLQDTDFDDQKIAALAGVEEDFVKAIRSNMIDF